MELLTTGISANIYQDGITHKTNEGKAIIDLYLSSLHNENTRKMYGSKINEFFEWLYPETELTLELMIIRTGQAEDYGNLWRSKVKTKDNPNGTIKASTYNSRIKPLVHFYKWLINKTLDNKSNVKLFNIHPFVNVKQMAENDSEGSAPLTPDEMSLMLNNVYGHDETSKKRNELLFSMAVTTGIRCDALVGAKIDDIIRVGEDWILKVIDKENKWHNKPINNYYDDLIAWYKMDRIYRKRDNGTIFGIHPVYANEVISKWADSVGIGKKITFHSLRTTTACEIYKNTNGNLYSVKMAMNHSHIETSQIYIDKGNVINRDAENILVNVEKVKQFEEFLQGKSKEELMEMLSSMDVSTKIKLMQR